MNLKVIETENDAGDAKKLRQNLVTARKARSEERQRIYLKTQNGPPMGSAGFVELK